MATKKKTSRASRATKKKKATKKKVAKKAATGRKASAPSSASKPKGLRGNKRGLNAEEYVRTMAQSQSGGCKVCCYPNIKKKVDEIAEQMDMQRVKIPAAQLLRDLKKHYDGFRCSDEKFRQHIRECMGRDL